MVGAYIDNVASPATRHDGLKQRNEMEVKENKDTGRLEVTVRGLLANGGERGGGIRAIFDMDGGYLCQLQLLGEEAGGDDTSVDLLGSLDVGGVRDEGGEKV